MGRKHVLRPTAIDLYSGIGGWALGLKLAGIDVIQSYEYWEEAARTHDENLGSGVRVQDIRELTREELLGHITAATDGKSIAVDYVVGSPPCTQFSYANRGGSGDLADGLKDIAKFLEVVTWLKPKAWAMENVPRVAGILEKELQPGGQLERFAHLNPAIVVIDTSDFGVPQKRKRCIAGSFSPSSLIEFAAKEPKKTLGDVISTMSKPGTVKDPNYRITLAAKKLTDHEPEMVLNSEELRMNSDAKTNHPIYNNMSFPDRLDVPVRTITATCTRVSRESVVIADPASEGNFRRLTVRERASCQGFPINYQFFGNSYSAKLKMVGNAIPPLFTYYLAHTLLGSSSEDVKNPLKLEFSPSCGEVPAHTPPDTEGRTYPKNRRFRAAVPSLRFKSGMRFDLSNIFEGDDVVWKFRFYFGNSKAVLETPLTNALVVRVSPMAAYIAIANQLDEAIDAIKKLLDGLDGQDVQAAWAHTIDTAGPYDIVDLVDGLAGNLIESIRKAFEDEVIAKEVLSFVDELTNDYSPDKRYRKAETYAAEIFVGAILCALVNEEVFAVLSDFPPSIAIAS